MELNILNNSRISTIFITYVDGHRLQKFQVYVRYLDKKECFVSTNVDTNCAPPKKNTKAKIMAYTEVGVYSCDVKIIDVNISPLRELTFNLTVPKNWDYKQLRTSTRKDVKVPFVIKYNDGYEIAGTTLDLSLGGISFISNIQIPEFYKQFNAKLTFDFSEYEEMNNFTADTKFLRINESAAVNEGEKLYIFRILDMSAADIQDLKNFLIKF